MPEDLMSLGIFIFHSILSSFHLISFRGKATMEEIEVQGGTL